MRWRERIVSKKSNIKNKHSLYQEIDEDDRWFTWKNIEYIESKVLAVAIPPFSKNNVI